MALNTVTITWDENDPTLSGIQGTITFVLSTILTDSTDGLVVHPVAKAYALGLGTSQPLVANDNSAALPTGSFYTITIQTQDGATYSFQAFLNHANGASQKLASLVPIVTQPSMLAYLPLPTGTPTSGTVPVATGVGDTTTWTGVAVDPMSGQGDTIYGGSGGAMTRLAADTSNTRKFLREQSVGGAGQAPAWDTLQAGDIPDLAYVDSVAAGDASISVGGTSDNPTVETGTLDQVANLHPAAANWSNNGHKITNAANGTTAGDVATFGQLPATDSTATDIQPDGTQAAGATGKFADAGHAHPENAGWTATDNGLLVANFDYGSTAGSVLLTAGTVYLAKLMIREAITLSYLWWNCATGGAGSSTGSFTGLYSSSGSLLTGSSDIGASFTTLGGKQCQLTTAQALAAGTFVWAAVVFNLATTMPTLQRGVGTSQLANVNLSAASFRWASNGTGQTSLPASITPSSNVATANTLWVGGS